MATTGLSCTVGTPLPSDMIIDGFGLGRHARVQEDSSGTLGGAVSGTITNSGSTAAPAGYIVEAKVEAMGLRALGGSAGFVPGKTLFDCKKNGPPLGAGKSTTITFHFGSGGCPPLAVTSLPCGLYRETLTIRGVDHGKRFIKRCTLYIYVPSAVKDIQLLITVNPDNLPLEPPSPPGFIIIDAIDDRFNLIAPHCPTPKFQGNAVRVKITGVPPASLFIVTGKGRTDLVSGSRTSYNPNLPVGQPNGVKGPKTINYVLTVPNTRFNTAPCNDIGPPPNYDAKLDGTITAISVERKGTARIFGCVIKQKTLRVSARFECR